MLGYLIYYMPFDDLVINLLNIYNEVILLIGFITSLVMTLEDFSDTTNKTWGWIIIGMIILSLVLTWMIIFPKVIMEVCQLLGYCKKDKAIVKLEVKELNKKVKINFD